MPPFESAPVVDVEQFVRLTDVPPDEAYELLANSRTRLTLHVLSTCAPPFSVDRLTDIVSSRDDADEYAVHVSLAHAVLPKLEAHGLLEYDADAGLIYLDRPVVDVETPVAELSDVPRWPGANSPPT
ncbi:DUF7344 domain-containing protein [Natrinema caseinilyticum]|uniref:DUF7344 domain-containing protein n=1 Tax=Natrinema caseinilyticum TaxID=2961570 RepID=UPI0020C5A8F4|nr:hypothetical protein [Natrinema caseinilyticum]